MDHDRFPTGVTASRCRRARGLRPFSFVFLAFVSLMLLTALAACSSAGDAEVAGTTATPTADDEETVTASPTEEIAEAAPVTLINHVTFDAEAVGWLEDLQGQEVVDQVRDWTQYAFASSLGLSSDEAGGFLFDKVPLRDPLFADVSEMRIGSGRFVPDFASDRLYLLIDSDDPNPDRTAALLFDDFLTDAAEGLAEVAIVEMAVGSSGERVDFSSPTLFGVEDFLNGHGRVQATIDESADLEDFLASIDHLSGVSVEGDEVRVRGWNWASTDFPPLTLDDIAVLNASYGNRADSDRDSPGFSLDPLPLELEEQALRAFVPEIEDWLWTAVVDLADFYYLASLPQSELTAEEADFLDLVEEDAEYGEFLFTVDAVVEEGLFGDDAVLAEAADALEIEPNRAKFWALSSFLRGGPVASAARYEGATRGTEVGMTLFYTDLIAKDWSSGVGAGVPSSNGLDGFVSTHSLATNWSYCPSSSESGRLWFGLDSSAVAGSGRSLALGAVATRLFSRADSVDGSGVEVEPSYHFGAALAWWDANFQRVADYEPQFQRLDQIMRWSAALAWLAETGSPLDTPPPAASDGLRFVDWFGAQVDLRESDPPLSVDIGSDVEVVFPAPTAPYERCGGPFVQGGVTLAPARILSTVKGFADDVSRPLTRARTIEVTPRPGNVTHISSGVYDDFANPVQVVDRTVALRADGVSVSGTAHGTLQGGIGPVHLPGSAETVRPFRLDHKVAPNGWATESSAYGQQFGRVASELIDGGASVVFTRSIGARLHRFVTRLQDRLSTAPPGRLLDEALADIGDVDLTVRQSDGWSVKTNNGEWVAVRKSRNGRGDGPIAQVNRIGDDSIADPWFVAATDDVPLRSRANELADQGYRTIGADSVKVEAITSTASVDSAQAAGIRFYSLIDEGQVTIRGVNPGDRVKLTRVEMTAQDAPDALLVGSDSYAQIGTAAAAVIETAIVIESCSDDDDDSLCLIIGS